MRLWTLMTVPLLITLIGVPAASAQPEPKISVVVKTVLASEKSDFVDPRLKGLIRELKSIFRYSSYRLLSQRRMNLRMGQIGTQSLPGKRTLKIKPMRITGNRVKLQLRILKKNRQTFQTVIQLLNRGSITVGGPTHKNGYLLFNIYSSF